MTTTYKKGDVVRIVGNVRFIYKGERVVPNIQIQPTKLDFQAIRKNRQSETHDTIVRSIMEKNELPLHNVNAKQLDELLVESGISEDLLIDKCKRDRLYAISVARNIAIKASRQGTRDETAQISVCDKMARQFGICIENIDNRAYRPTKSGKILSKDELAKQNVPNNDCLKSFDAKISGRMSGWIFAKVVYGTGGHQDNVFVESDEMCNWVKRFRDPNTNEVFIVLIDTDLVKKLDILRKKYNGIDGLYIMDHVEFQQYIIDSFTPQ